MLRECAEHGYFRGDKCPLCGEEGKFLMNDDEIDRISRLMAGVLRHFPERLGLHMDERGFVEIKELVDAIKSQRGRRFRWLRTKHIIALARTDPKQRYEVRGTKIRATYGHSIDVVLDLPEDDIPPRLYYPASEDEIETIMNEGITPSDRKMVHLSATARDAMEAGKHHTDNPIILEIDAEGARENGIHIMKAGTTVYICDFVPPEYIKEYSEER